MSAAHLEAAFEAEIVAHLVAHGWHQGDRTAYRRNLGLDTGELFTFLGATQPENWDKLLALHGGADRAQQRFAKRLADELTSRGTVDVLRRGVTDLGVHVDLLYPEPAHELTPELRELYDANRCTVTRQLPHSESRPERDRPDPVRHRHPGRDRGAQDPDDGSERDRRDPPVPRRPQPDRPDLRVAGAGALGRRHHHRRDDHGADGRHDRLPPVQPRQRRSGAGRRQGQPGQPRGARHGVPVGTGVAAPAPGSTCSRRSRTSRSAP